MLAKVHDDICGSHSNGLALAQKLLRASYYWPTMQVDFVLYAKSYKKCQLHGNLIHTPKCKLSLPLHIGHFINGPLTW